jgi:hypothetical protein
VAPIWVAPIFIVIVGVIAGLVTDTWLTVSGLGTLYALCLPLGWASYRMRAKREVI